MDRGAAEGLQPQVDQQKQELEKLKADSIALQQDIEAQKKELTHLKDTKRRLDNEYSQNQEQLHDRMREFFQALGLVEAEIKDDEETLGILESAMNDSAFQKKLDEIGKSLRPKLDEIARLLEDAKRVKAEILRAQEQK